MGGQPTILLDQSSAETDVFPYVIVLTLGLAAIVIGVAFRSIVIPLKTIGSLVLTEGFVFGLAVLTYEHGIFDWIGFKGLSSNLGGVQFFLPIAVFAMVAGLCLGKCLAYRAA